MRLTAAMNQKIVLITGCSSGIGLALAVRIAKDEKKRFIGKLMGTLWVEQNLDISCYGNQNVMFIPSLSMDEISAIC